MASDKACVLCNNTKDDPVGLGQKYTYKNVTTHYFCLLLSSNLMPNGDDNKGIMGFMPNDVNKEVHRSRILFCTYCRKRGASIGCCIKSCKRSFHYPCALENDCRFEFVDSFASYCHEHIDIDPPEKIHKPTDLCMICSDEMGQYNRIRSIQSPCCNTDSWYHKYCLMKLAKSSGYFFKCPLCNDKDYFRQEITKMGVFIPDKDADWEETGPDSFYDFQTHSDRPEKCVAEECKCKRGRNHSSDNENSRNFLICCDSCGSSAVHRCCLTSKNYLCSICLPVARNNTSAGTSDAGFDEPVNSSSSRSDSENSERERESSRHARRHRRSNSRINSSQSSSRSGRSSSSRANSRVSTVYSDETDDEYTSIVYHKTETTTTTTSRVFNPRRLAKEFHLRNCSVKLSPLRSWYPDIHHINLGNQSDETDDEEHEMSDDDAETATSDTNSHNTTNCSEHNNNDVFKNAKRNLSEIFSPTDPDDSDNIRPISIVRKNVILSSSDDNESDIPIGSVSKNLCYKNLLAEFDSESDNDKNAVNLNILAKVIFESHVTPIKEERQEDQENEYPVNAVRLNERVRLLSSSSESQKTSESSSDEAHQIAQNLLNQRKRKFIHNYFQSSSEDSSTESKRPSLPKRMKLFKTPRKFSTPAKSPNQPSIMDLFNAQLNRSG